MSDLSVMDDIDYSLWKTTRSIKKPYVHVPLIRQEYSTLVRGEQDKAETFT